MKKTLIWLLDDEWKDHELEFELLKDAVPDADIRLTTKDFEQDLAAFGKSADVIITQISFTFTREILSQLERCKGIAVTGSGYNNMDVQAAKELGIPEPSKSVDFQYAPGKEWRNSWKNKINK